MNIIAIIPARGGSKGIPKKNIALLAGKPLIAYTIEEAKKSKYINRIIVSTDSEEIANVSREYGAEVIIRPKELAQDTTPTLPVLKHVLENVEKEYCVNLIVVLQPTSPLRKVEYIDLAIKKLMDENCDSVVSVCKFDHSPAAIVSVEDDKLQMTSTNSNKFRRQDSNLYLINGAVYVVKRDIMMKLDNYIVGGDIRIIVMPKEASVDIDEPIDLKLAESFLKEDKDNITHIKIGDKLIGKDQPCFIIAEAGVNHNGNIEIAKRLIDAAIEAKADAVKFQTFKSENLVTQKADMASYQEKNIGKIETQFEMLKKLEMKYSDFERLKKYCDDKGIIFLSTPHTEDASEALVDLVPAFKLGSGDLNNLPFLKKIAKYEKPIILPTGMSTMNEVKEALKTIYKEGNKQVIALHCTTNYPCPYEEVNLKAMQAMQNELDCLVGYSDHTLGIIVPVMAVTSGAVLIEKHFTLDKNMEGPDHKASLNAKELKEMVQQIRIAEKSFGSNVKEPTKSELSIMKVVRKSIVAKIDIKKGSVITEYMLIIKRPGTGIEPKYINTIVGKTAKKDITKDKLIKREDIK
ncbi:N-acetylneuraminate synthase [Candidatus Woesearchaeota archaeon]|nr:N-acetylneuraminate synthase [Candidatus Woesearchaeota archaeon]